MKYVLPLLLVGCASSGHFVDRGLFNNQPFVTASGANPERAQASALAAMPPGFERDKTFEKPVLSCGLPGEAPVWDETRKANTRCLSGKYRVDFALLPTSGTERDAILKTREQN